MDWNVHVCLILVGKRWDESESSESNDEWWLWRKWQKPVNRNSKSSGRKDDKNTTKEYVEELKGPILEGKSVESTNPIWFWFRVLNQIERKAEHMGQMGVGIDVYTLFPFSF